MHFLTADFTRTKFPVRSRSTSSSCQTPQNELYTPLAPVEPDSSGLPFFYFSFSRKDSERPQTMRLKFQTLWLASGGQYTRTDHSAVRLTKLLIIDSSRFGKTGVPGASRGIAFKTNPNQIYGSFRVYIFNLLLRAGHPFRRPNRPGTAGNKPKKRKKIAH